MFDENSIEKWNLYLLLGEFVSKNRAFEITSFFSRFGGGVGLNPLP